MTSHTCQILTRASNLFADGVKQLFIHNGVVVWTYAVRTSSDPNDFDVYYAVHVYTKAKGVLTATLQDEMLAPSAQYDDQGRVHVNFDGANYYIDLKTWTYTTSTTEAWNLQANSMSDVSVISSLRLKRYLVEMN